MSESKHDDETIAEVVELLESRFEGDWTERDDRVNELQAKLDAMHRLTTVLAVAALMMGFLLACKILTH